MNSDKFTDRAADSSKPKFRPNKDGLDSEALARVARMVQKTTDKLRSKPELDRHEFTVFAAIASKEEELLKRDDISPRVKAALEAAHEKVLGHIGYLQEDKGNGEEETAKPRRGLDTTVVEPPSIAPAEQAKIIQTLAGEANVEDFKASLQNPELQKFFSDLGAITMLDELDYDKILVKLQEFDAHKERLMQLLVSTAAETQGSLGSIINFGVKNIIIEMEKFRALPTQRLHEIPHRLKELIAFEWPLDITKLKEIGETASRVIHHPLTDYVDPSGKLKDLGYQCHWAFSGILSLNSAYEPTLHDLETKFRAEDGMDEEDIETLLPDIRENFRSFATFYVEYLLADEEDREEMKEMIEEMEEEYLEILEKGA